MMTPPRTIRTATLILAALLAAMSGCESGMSTTPSRPSRAELGAATRPDRTNVSETVDATAIEDLSYTISAWAFKGTRGRILETPSYRIHTTIANPRQFDQFPQFAEQALAHYRSALADLPRPTKRFDTFLFAQRSEWQAYTRDLFNDDATLYLGLGRGGYSLRGTAVLFDIGYGDTLSIMAHEGWHQYTQQVFAHSLPVWLEEGIATYMEGRRVQGDTTRFDPWMNRQRLNMLRRAARSGDLFKLDVLVRRAPQQFLREDQEKLLVYYSQVWALVHFLVEGEDGRYADSLRRLLVDAANGRLASTIMNSTNIPRNQRREMATSKLGRGAALAYFNEDWAAFSDEYDAFVRRIVRGGSRRSGSSSQE